MQRPVAHVVLIMAIGLLVYSNTLGDPVLHGCSVYYGKSVCQGRSFLC